MTKKTAKMTKTTVLDDFEAKTMTLLKDNTKTNDTYQSYLVYLALLKKMIHKNFSNETEPFTFIFKNPNKIHKLLLDNTDINSPSSYLNYLTPINNIIIIDNKTEDKFINNYFKKQVSIYNKLYLSYKEQKETKAKNNEQPKNYLPFKTIFDKYNELFVEFKNDVKHNAINDWYKHQRFIALACFVLLTPKRADLGDIFIDRTNLVKTKYPLPTKEQLDKINYIDLKSKNPKLILHQFKTDWFYEDNVEELPTTLVYIINESLRIFPRNFLFGSYSKTDKEDDGSYVFVPYVGKVGANSYTKMIARTFKTYLGVPIAVNSFRHIWVEFFIDHNAMNGNEIDKIAKLMGTSSSTISNYYKIVKKHNEKK